MTLDATGLNGGDYDASIVVASNDPDEPEAGVPTHLHVTGAPTWTCPTALDFGPVFVGGSAQRTATVSNPGTDVLTVTGVTLDHPDFTADAPAAFTLAPGQSRIVTLTYAPGAPVPATATMVVASDDPDEPELAVALAGQGVVAPLIGVSHGFFSESLITGETVTRTISIANVEVATCLSPSRLPGVPSPLLPAPPLLPTPGAPRPTAPYDAGELREPAVPALAPPPRPGHLPSSRSERWDTIDRQMLSSSRHP